MSKSKGQPWTEDRVCDAMQHVFPSEAFATIRGVRNGTGFSRRQNRTADALVFSCWPSRGLWLAGVEIKVSRGDWTRELRDPEKSAEIQQFCNHWFVAAPAGVVPHDQLPQTWGLIECDDKGKSKIVVPAPTLNAKPLDMSFVCSIMRTIAKSHVPASQVAEQVRERVAVEMERERKNLLFGMERLGKRIQQFEEVSGVSIGEYNAGNIGEAVRRVLEMRHMGQTDPLAGLRNHAELAIEKARKIIAICDGKETDAS